MTTKLTPETVKNLHNAAVRINEASNKLNAQLDIINEALKRLNIGIGFDYPLPDIKLTLSYARLDDDKGWGLIISNDKEQWPIARAPRHMRIKVVEFIPIFVEKLVTEVDNSTKEIEYAANLAELMVSGIPKDLKK